MSKTLFRYTVQSLDTEVMPAKHDFTEFEEALLFSRDLWKTTHVIAPVHAYGEEQRDPKERLPNSPINPHMGVCYGKLDFGCHTDVLICRRLEGDGFVFVSGYANKTFPELFAEAEEKNDRSLEPAFVTYEAAANFDRERYCKPPIEVTKEHYWEMMECLPPMRMTNVGGVQSFFMSEALTGNLRACLVNIGNRYFEFTTEVIPPEEVARIVTSSQAWLNHPQTTEGNNHE